MPSRSVEYFTTSKPTSIYCCSQIITNIYVTETGQGNELAWVVGLVYPFLTGTGPLACLSLFPVADVDKVSNDQEIRLDCFYPVYPC